MIGPSGAVRVMLATRPVDFRKGMDGLAMLVREQLGTDPFCGTVFRAARRGDFAATDPALETLLGRPPRTMREVLASAGR